ncbi:glycosyltransferase family 87 protein [Qipengyuania sp. MTN3-11]|uniref:glycosyltransferase family 87 protein n=1 Tax=Qipengyuania sp. MTN3-11 TaxID=3056557 RepID=UPI0036F223C4
MTLREALRDAGWLDGPRVRAYAAMVGLASLAVLWFAWRDAVGSTGSDFLAFWGAGKAVLAGNPAAAYDIATQQAIQTGTGSQGWFVFVNPPPFLFAVAPFGSLPYPLAWIAWTSITYALWAWAGVRAFPRLWPLVLAYPGALVAATHGQNGLLTGALLVAAVTMLAAGRPIRAGAAIGALVIKPHLALLLPFWLAAGRRWSAFIAAGATLAGLLLASWLVFGGETISGYTESWAASGALMAAGGADFLIRMASWYAQLRHHLGEPTAIGGASVLALAMIGMALASWRHFDGDPRASGAAVLAATALAPPYLFNYDLPFLIVPTLWLVEQGLARGFRPYEKLALAGLWFAPYATRAAAFPLEMNLMPLAAFALLALVWTRRALPQGHGPLPS